MAIKWTNPTAGRKCECVSIANAHGFAMSIYDVGTRFEALIVPRHDHFGKTTPTQLAAEEWAETELVNILRAYRDGATQLLTKLGVDEGLEVPDE